MNEKVTFVQIFNFTRNTIVQDRIILRHDRDEGYQTKIKIENTNDVWWVRCSFTEYVCVRCGGRARYLLYEVRERERSGENEGDRERKNKDRMRDWYRI